MNARLALLALTATLSLAASAQAQRLIPAADRRPAPAFDLAQVAGPSTHQAAASRGRLTSAGLAGKVLVLDLWAVGCVPCGPAHEALVAAAPLLADSGVVILSVGSPDDSVAATEWVHEHGGPVFPVVLLNQPLSEALEVTGWPRMVIIDAKGRVAYDGFGHSPGEFLPRVLPALIAEREGRAAPRDANRLF